jgi:hypothetical protein
MTADNFVFWLAGLLTCVPNGEGLSVEDTKKIGEAIKQVELESNANYIIGLTMPEREGCI